MTPYENAVRLWRSWKVTTPSDLDQRLDSFRVLFAYHSGKIENDAITYSDTREVFEDGKVRSFEGDPRTLFEMQNQKTCYTFLLPKITGGEPLTVALVKEIHGILTAGTYDERRFLEKGERPGEFKCHDYVTGIHEVGSAPEDVEADLSDLLDEVDGAAKNGLSPENALKAAAYLHARFENIHPFADGNGRVGRTLANYFLMAANHPPLIVYEDDRKEYYAALQMYDEHEEIEPLFRFFQRETARTWEKALERAGGGRPGRSKGLDDLIR